MTIRRLVFILFLYILLVWIVAALLHGGDAKQLIYFGLLWTAVGVGALLVIVVLERLVSWWWARRAEKATTPPGAREASPRALHEDDAEFIRLLREADQRLGQAPGRPPAKSSRTLPLYLILGPERAGKTAIVHNCGIEPALLAGQAVGGDGSVTPTKVANLWLAHESLFLEVGGRLFNGEPSRLAELLGLLQPGGRARGWRGWLKIFQSPLRLRGVVLAVDSRAFTGTPEPSALDRCAMQVRERLSVVSSVIEAEFPVYVIFTNADAIPYFEEFVSGVGDGEARQALGVLIPEALQGHMQERVWAEGETKRLSRFFQALFLKLSDRRLVALAQETDLRHKAAIYEFPREFKRIRAPLVQFLIDVFKPDPLKATPRLRGFFFTGIRKEERAAAASRDEQSTHWSSGMAPDATRIFSPGAASTIFRPRPAAASGALVNRWMFLTEFFHGVLGSDQPSIRRSPAKVDRYRKIAVAAAAGLASLMTLLWTVSWVGNRNLKAGVTERIREARRGSDDLSLANLQALDRLRAQLEQLDKDRWYLHWGLYQGDDLRQIARRVYFQRLKGLSLDRINRTMIADLNRAGGPGTDENVTYDELKTHRTITVLACPANPPFLSRRLESTAVNAHPNLGGPQRDLLAVQLRFYAADIGKTGRLPVPLDEDRAAETNAQAYLRQTSGPAQKLRGLLDQVEQTPVPRIIAADSVRDLKLVLRGQEEVRGAFTARGRQRFEDLVAQGKLGFEEPCVTGTPVSQEIKEMAKAVDHPGMKEQLQTLYYEQYVAAWREFLGSYHVLGHPKGYTTAEDAAGKLDRMAAPRSPLLGLVRLVADNTNFPAADGEAPGLLDKTGEVVKGLVERGTPRTRTGARLQRGARLEQEVVGDRSASDRPAPMTAADVAKIFQPAIYTTPTESDQLVTENNRGYIGGLRALQGKMDGLARASTPAEKSAAMNEARTAQSQALNSLKQMADNFRASGDKGLDGALSALLEEPIRLADALLVVKSPVISKNEELRQQLCNPIIPILKKYPFNQSAKAEVSLEELETWFAPNSGRVWKYATGSGADLVSLRGEKWEPGQSPDMKASPELLNFLNAALHLRKAFFADGGAEAGFTYKLRPAGGQTVSIQLTLDGAKLDSGESSLQKTFRWPAPSVDKRGALATRVLGPGSTDGFGAYPDLWGAFRLFKIAENRPAGTKLVQWSYHQGADGAERQSFSPSAKVEFVEFPADQDVFNPAFFESLGQCPKVAAIAN